MALYYQNLVNEKNNLVKKMSDLLLVDDNNLLAKTRDQYNEVDKKIKELTNNYTILPEVQHDFYKKKQSVFSNDTEIFWSPKNKLHEKYVKKCKTDQENLLKSHKLEEKFYKLDNIKEIYQEEITTKKNKKFYDISIKELIEPQQEITKEDYTKDYSEY